MAFIRGLVVMVTIVSAIEARGLFDSSNRISKLNSTLANFGPAEVYQIDSNKEYRDCQERWSDGERVPGVYTIHPKEKLPIHVYCNHSLETSYTVIQRRYYGNENFNRGWAEYKFGFGTLQGDYWLGLDSISRLSRGYSKMNMMIQMTDWAGITQTIYLIGVKVQPESLYYRLTYTGYSGGGLTNGLSMNNGMYFYSPDRPDQGNCAVLQKCGWWFNAQQRCTDALLNGVYYYGGAYSPGAYYDGIYYNGWHGYAYSLRYVTMSLYR
ncbi:hypothetical protein CAPTEDRAFT_158334 [Capitella teleta]|uniref:Fibrinogen C-terminal domain-containing protein n=1 Tax=Capitella teleta TaxID=283909 RepID=R7V7D9_CAPTE|nr:hypothetical protein CAPTEDRAFT_158334 [Capitella teleta]|eukprot:ELU14387.1 hypothetical protein CAPTEDRAFT_158334 [Capitella teleta]